MFTHITPTAHNVHSLNAIKMFLPFKSVCSLARTSDSFWNIAPVYTYTRTKYVPYTSPHIWRSKKICLSSQIDSFSFHIFRWKNHRLSYRNKRKRFFVCIVEHTSKPSSYTTLLLSYIHIPSFRLTIFIFF